MDHEVQMMHWLRITQVYSGQGSEVVCNGIGA